MLELRPSCEHCAHPLPPDALDARICSFECTFCADCTDRVLAGVCPNCAGELVTRPVRPAALVDSAPAGTEMVHSPVDVATHRALLDHRPGGEDHPGVALRRYGHAWSTGDLDGVLDRYDPGFVLIYDGGSRFAGVHKGKEAAVEVMAEVSALAPRTLVRIDEVQVADRTGALVVTERLEREGEVAEVRRTLQYTVADGRLTSCHLFEHDRSTVDHFWR